MPKRIGKYEITAEIGRGGFSRVYRGFDPNVNRPVAIKVSTRESDPDHLSRFRNEASAAGNLRHENIVTIHDYGDDDGVPYLVMELLEGRDLYHIMRDGPKLSLLDKMQVMSQVAQGLQCAHENGVVHRDIKPANVMVLADGTVKILDFGIARMTGEVSRLTQSGYLVGTPLYMSPEQLSGADADALGDVWAFGVLYFELLTGQHPFLSQDNTRLIRNITIVNPPSVHSLTRGVPEGLAQVIRRALAKDRRRRYQSLDDVLVDTNPILGMLQREQTAGLVTEAQSYRNSGQLMAARQSSRRALEIDPSNPGAQQLLKSIQHDMQVESLAAPEAPAKPAVIEKRVEVAVPPPPPPPVPQRVVTPVVARDEPEMILPDETPAIAAAAPVAPVVQTPVVPPPPLKIITPPAPIVEAPIAATFAVPAPVAAPSVAPAPVATPVAAAPPVSSAIETPQPSTQRPRPATVSGAAAAIAAAVAAAKARQAEEERQQRERKQEEGEAAATSAPAIRATPLVVSALPTGRVAPAPPVTASLKRAENGSGVFVTDDPLVVKRPASSVMTQRMKAAESTAAVATPVPAPPPTRLPGTKAIPASVPRSAPVEPNDVKPPEVPSEIRTTSENLPMRRPPSEVYAKGRRRRSSNSIFAEKEKPKKPFPWAVIGFVVAVAMAAAALVLFTLSAPKYASTLTLAPEKMQFAWKPMTAFPPEQVLTLKGGAAGLSFTASSNDDWLVVTPETEEANNRSWQIKVEPDKLGATTPGTTTGWIDVTSTEGFKTQAEVTLKIGAADATPAVKGHKTAPAIAPAPKVEKPGNQKAEKIPAPVATVVPVVTKPLSDKTTPTDAGAPNSAKTAKGKATEKAAVVTDSTGAVKGKPTVTPTTIPSTPAKKPEQTVKPPAIDGTEIN